MKSRTTTGSQRPVIKAPDRIETPRLLLVRPVVSNAHEVFERYAGDPDVTRYLGWPRHLTAADTRSWLELTAVEWARWPAGAYLIRLRADESLVGGTGLAFATAGEAATGYVLAKDAWGRGYATEALAAIVALARAVGVRRLTALCHPDHRASARVLEKNGFVRDPAPRPVEFPNLAPGIMQEALCYVLDTGRRPSARAR